MSVASRGRLRRWRGGILLVTALAAPLPAQGAPLLTLPDTSLFPEGIARDEVRGRWLLSSIRRRTIVAVDDDGRLSPFARDLPPDVGAILGLAIDPARGLLFATAAAVPPMQGFAPADTLRAEVLELDLASGALRRRITLPDSPRQRIPGDAVLAPDGTLFVSDANAGRLYAIAPGGSVRVITSPLFVSLQGIVLADTARALIVADYRNGLLRVPLVPGDTVRAVTDAEGRRLQGIDGLAWHGDALIATYNGRLPGRVMRITLSADRRGIADVTTLETVPGIGEPTLGVVRDGHFIFIANSPWSAYDERGARRAGTALAPPELRRLPLPR